MSAVIRSTTGVIPLYIRAMSMHLQKMVHPQVVRNNPRGDAVLPEEKRETQLVPVRPAHVLAHPGTVQFSDPSHFIVAHDDAGCIETSGVETLRTIMRHLLEDGEIAVFRHLG